MMVSLYEHQKAELEATEGMSHVAYYHDMGLGKTFTGAEKMERLGAKVNLIICQKSKVADWVEHINEHYYSMVAWDMTDKLGFDSFMLWTTHAEDSATKTVGVINYELAWRRKELLQLQGFTLMLDESSLIQNERAKRSKFIMSLKPANVILLSGTPVGGKYERLWSQMKLLGWNISRDMYWRQYVNVQYIDGIGRGIPVVRGYKNVARLKRKMAEYGCRFLTSSDVFDMPDQNFIKVKVEPTATYRIFKKHGICEVMGGVELVGDTLLTKMLYERQLCGQYNAAKLQAFADLVDSTEDRLIVFYNFNNELAAMKDAVAKSVKRDVSYSIVNGEIKDLAAYERYADSITFVQYQAGAMGLNLQKANKVIYFTLPLSSELFEQSKKRIHRIGQKRACFYYLMLCKGTIEEKILAALQVRKDYTEKLFQRGNC